MSVRKITRNSFLRDIFNPFHTEVKTLKCQFNYWVGTKMKTRNEIVCALLSVVLAALVLHWRLCARGVGLSLNTARVRAFALCSVDPFSRKEWYEVKAPSSFAVRNACKTCVNRTSGTSALLLPPAVACLLGWWRCLFCGGVGQH